MSGTVSLPAFAEPVADAQATFRAVLDAMARPGTLHQVGQNLTPPRPLDRATAAVLLTLIDNETPLWLDCVAAAARDWIVFHSGATITEDAGKAEFALALSPPDLIAFSVGSHEAPENSVTIIAQLAALGSGTSYRLFGPGLRQPLLFSATGLPENFVTAWHRNHALFPCGVDIILCAGSQVAALPRSLSIEEV